MLRISINVIIIAILWGHKYATSPTESQFIEPTSPEHAATNESSSESPVAEYNSTFCYTIQEYPVPEALTLTMSRRLLMVLYGIPRSVGALGRLDPSLARRVISRLGPVRAHGVIVGPDGAPWITDSGLNAIVRVDPQTEEYRSIVAPSSGYANLNTAVLMTRDTLVHGTKRHLRSA